MTIRVRTPARLHLGLLDTNGDLGRLYGGIGVAVEHPNVVLEAEPADHLLVEGLEAAQVTAFAQRFLDRYPAPRGARLRLKAAIPRHIGLGSGTQLALAVGTALAALGGLQLGVADIARTMGRGSHSGIGIAAFEQGGFVLDGGHRVSREPETAIAAEVQLPPLLFRYPFPQDWYFVVAVPETEVGFSGEREKHAFATLPRAPAEPVEKISRLLLMKMLPSLIERDIAGFGQALTAIQQLVGDCFASAQGGRYGHSLSEPLINYLLDRGAAGAGQSSWGPTVYGLVEGEGPAQRLAGEAHAFLASHGGGQTLCLRADNRGARIRRTAAPGGKSKRSS